MRIAKRPSLRRSQQKTTRKSEAPKPQSTRKHDDLQQSRKASEGLRQRLKDNADKQHLPTFRSPTSSQIREQVNKTLDNTRAVAAQTDNVRDALKNDDPPVTREVLNDPSHVTRRTVKEDDIDDVNGDGTIDNNDVRAAIEANQEPVTEALEALPTEQQEMYQGLQEDVEGDVRAELALQEMLLEGDLPGEASSTEGTNLLEELDRMSNLEELGEGIDQSSLVADTIQEIHNPSSIAQLDTPTCAPTTAAIYLAETKPAEYARIVTDLAGPGESTLANGDTITRQSTGDEESRSKSLELFAGAAMEYADGADYDYNNETYEHIDGEGDARDGDGLFSREYDRIFDAITGVDTQAVTVNDDNRSENMDRIQETIDDGEMVPVGIKWGEGGHKLLVTGMDDEHVYYTNPWGKEERMEVGEFEARLKNAHFMPDEKTSFMDRFFGWLP
ncbi:MAG TPA: hypothetical protein DCE42_23150 [Myxococcales bacterium]|nr:hypothetical protein [Deltaproteobacteria bacterium]MBU47453.1 hypothetical protein [Deltaproteobacteria bacterium]HAA57684.1 hypothetical protein [Myxococcales bacterium]|tara:strand:- start:171 stop:1505 length:1335 start_codon:yes stop_codon:yes gene_type:complete